MATASMGGHNVASRNAVDAIMIREDAELIATSGAQTLVVQPSNYADIPSVFVGKIYHGRKDGKGHGNVAAGIPNIHPATVTKLTAAIRKVAKGLPGADWDGPTMTGAEALARLGVESAEAPGPVTTRKAAAPEVSSDRLDRLEAAILALTESRAD